MENKDRTNQFVEMENDVLAFWEANKIFERSVAKESPKGEYVFYDGPPFATGTPHYGHLVASLMKDVVPRFWTMNGFKVERKWGWDCHGLPIENIVEKELGSESKKNIEENIGVEKFNELCRSKVLTYVEEWKKTVTRLGRWVDMDNAYKTMDLPFMESVWWVFKQLWDKGLIYKDYRSMHVCPRCETTLSQSEVAEGYKDVKDLSVTAKFELVDEAASAKTSESQARTFVLAWTTTPWTLPGNVALAVGESIKYQVLSIEGEDSRYILAAERVETVFKDKKFKVIKEVEGKELVGKGYKPLFDVYAKDEKTENRERGWKIYAADFVTTTDGTGVVHIAPAFGDDDLKVGRENKLPFIQHVSMDGHFKPEMGEMAGLNVKPKDDVQSTDVVIIKYLAAKGLLFSKEKYEHSYPHCWRCDTPLINYATSSWFVKISDIKPKALETAKDINWFPEHIKDGRFGQWLDGARDWSISRQRFWASCMPIWECPACGKREVFGSAAELEKASGQKVNDLHKHILDKVEYECGKCGGTMKRVPDVLDTWFDSGSMPYAQMHYPFENKEKFERNFPAEFIAEGVDQTRCWFYYLHAIANGIKESRAYNHVIVNGIVLAEDGKKMSKKLKNYPDPNEVLERHGADALRYYLLTSPVMAAENLNFSEKGVMEVLRKINMLLWNVYKFYEMYADASPVDFQFSHSENILDRWIMARLDQLIAEVSDGMNKYDLPRATRPIAVFIDDLSTWYLRRSRDRFKEDGDDKRSALDTTKVVLVELAKVMAPFTPFIAEQLWQKASGLNFSDQEASVHLEAWPSRLAVKDAGEGNILEEMALARKIVELGLSKRDEVGIKVRQPLNQLTIVNYELSAEFQELVKDELNVKEIVLKKGEGELSVDLDTNITPELAAEGLKRELVRLINAERKGLGLSIGDRVKIFYSTESDLVKNVFSIFLEDLKRDVLADEIAMADVDGGKEVKANGETLIVKIEKI